MMTINTVVASTTFSMETISIDGINFRIGFVEKMDNFPYAISVTDIAYSDGVNAGGVIFAINDIIKCCENYGENFTKSFVSFVLAHEVGHLIDFKHNPMVAAIGGLSVGIDREVIADTYAIRNNSISLSQYRQFMNVLLNEALNVEKAVCKNHRILCHIVSAIDKRNMTKRYRSVMESVKNRKGVSVNLAFGDIAEKLITGIKRLS